MYLKPPPEAEEEGNLWNLKKCVYGLTDASKNWYFSVCEELKKLGCEQPGIDTALLRWYEQDNFIGLFLIHVDDFIYCGSAAFEKVSQDFCSSYLVGTHSEGAFSYIGYRSNSRQTALFLISVSMSRIYSLFISVLCVQVESRML